MFIEGEIPNVVTTTNGGGNNGGGFMNGDGWWAIILFALIFGYGRNGFGGGFGGFGGGSSGVGENYILATDFATIERKLDGVNNGLCDGFYAQNTNMLNGFANVQQTLCQGFNGVNTAIYQNGFNTETPIFIALADTKTSGTYTSLFLNFSPIIPIPSRSPLVSISSTFAPSSIAC